MELPALAVKLARHLVTSRTLRVVLGRNCSRDASKQCPPKRMMLLDELRALLIYSPVGGPYARNI